MHLSAMRFLAVYDFAARWFIPHQASGFSGSSAITCDVDN